MEGKGNVTKLERNERPKVRVPLSISLARKRAPSFSPSKPLFSISRTRKGKAKARKAHTGCCFVVSGYSSRNVPGGRTFSFFQTAASKGEEETPRGVPLFGYCGSFFRDMGGEVYFLLSLRCPVGGKRDARGAQGEGK